MIDLLCVVADKNMEAAVSGVLGRPEALGIRRIRHELLVHPRRDSGCFHESAELLVDRLGDAEHALVILDADWDGAPADSAEELEHLLESELEERGMRDWARAVVIEPELEAWVFSDSPHVATALGWDGTMTSLREELDRRGAWPRSNRKPDEPKAVVEDMLRRARKPRSSAFFRGLAGRVSLKRCEDRSFDRLRSLLRDWFPPSTARSS